MIIKSLTHLKRSLQVGDMVKTTFHIKSKGHSMESDQNEYADERRPPREVVECNTTGFTLATMEKGGWKGRRVKYPQASNCRIEDGKLIIMGVDLDNPNNKHLIKWLTIEVEEQG